MGVVIKHSIRSSVISYLGILLGAFNILWLYPRFLEPEKIGLIRLLQDIPFLFALFVQLGASSITDRFFHHFRDGKNNNGFLSVLLIYPLIGYILFVLVFLVFNNYWKSLFASSSTLFVDYFIYLIPLTFFMMYTSIMEAYLRAHLNINWSNFVRDILVRIFFTVFVFIYAINLISFTWFINLIVLGYGISLLSLFIYSKQINILHFSLPTNWPKKSLIKEILTYLFFLIPGTAGSLIVQKIDTIMLAAIGIHALSANEGLENVAIYSLAYFISSVVEVPRKSISQISIPILSNAFKNNDMGTINTLYKKNSIIQLITGAFIFLLIWLNIDDFFLFVPNSETYKQGKYVILFIGISKLFDMATSINGEIIQFSKHFKFNLISIIFLSAVTVVLNNIFIPIYSITGAAIALSITIFFYNAIKTYFIWSKLKLNPFTKDMIPIIIITVLIIIYTLFSPYQPQTLLNSFIHMVARSIVFSILFYILIRKLKISEDLNKLIDKIILLVSKKTGAHWLQKFL